MPGARASHPFWLPALCTCWLYVDNLENGVILSYINGEIKIVGIQKSVLYNGGNLVIILCAFLFQKMNGEKDWTVFVNVNSTIWLPPRCGSCHLVIPTRPNPFTFADCRSLSFMFEKVILLSWLLIVLQFYTCSLDLLRSCERFHGIASYTGLVVTTRRPKSLWRLTDHDQLRVYMIRILVFS